MADPAVRLCNSKIQGGHMRQDRNASGNGSESAEALSARTALGQPIGKMHGETLPPFALYQAFPGSDYYGGSVAIQIGRSRPA